MKLSRYHSSDLPLESGSAPPSSYVAHGVEGDGGRCIGQTQSVNCAPPREITLMVATERPGLLAELSLHCAGEPDITLVQARTSDQSSLLQSVQQQQPDLLLLDKRLFVRMAPASVRVLRMQSPDMRVLLWCDDVSDQLVDELLQYRFHGLVLSDSPPHACVKAIRAVNRGEIWLTRTLLSNAVFGLSRALPARSEAVPPKADPLGAALHTLSPRESEVVAHLCEGCTNKEIARRLGIMEDTVKKHLQGVFSKLGVRRRAVVALFAARPPI